MAGSSNSRAGAVLGAVLLCLAAPAGATVFCEDASQCRARQSCVAGACTPLADKRVRILFPIAVDRIIDLDTGNRRGVLPDGVDKLVRGYLELSGFWHVLTADRNPEGAVLESLRQTTIDFQSWYDAGAYAVVKGSVKKGKDGRLVLTLRLFVTEEGGPRPLKRDVQHVKADDRHALKQAVARWVNELLTVYSGKGGVFDTRLAFAFRPRKGAPKQIGVMDMDGGRERLITTGGDINVLPSWAPGGLIAYTSFKANNPDLYLDGRKFSARPGMNTGASFHPKGKIVALTLSKDGNAEIYVLDARSGKIRRRLTRNSAIDTSPTWSSDGKRIAFVSDRSTGKPQIFRMTARGENVERLPQVGGYNTSPDWSPTADEVVYSAMVGGESYDIYAINLVDDTVSRLTEAGSNEEPHFSRDGRYIVYTSRRRGVQSIWIMTADGRNQRRVSRGEGIYMTPSWER